MRNPGASRHPARLNHHCHNSVLTEPSHLLMIHTPPTLLSTIVSATKSHQIHSHLSEEAQMLRTQFPFRAIVVAAVACSLPGCLALSFGGKSQQVDTVMTENPETQDRLAKIESRVEALEQQLTPQLSPPKLP